MPARPRRAPPASADAPRPRPGRALELEVPGAPRLERASFRLQEPAEIAAALKRSADRSGRPDALRFAMMLLAYYTQRTGPEHAPAVRKRLAEVRHALHRLYGRSPRGAGPRPAEAVGAARRGSARRGARRRGAAATMQRGA